MAIYKQVCGLITVHTMQPYSQQTRGHILCRLTDADGNTVFAMHGSQPGTATRCAVSCSLYVYIQAASNGTL